MQIPVCNSRMFQMTEGETAAFCYFVKLTLCSSLR